MHATSVLLFLMIIKLRTSGTFGKKSSYFSNKEDKNPFNRWTASDLTTQGTVKKPPGPNKFIIRVSQCVRGTGRTGSWHPVMRAFFKQNFRSTGNDCVHSD
jgi:hypothetical protein